MDGQTFDGNTLLGSLEDLKENINRVIEERRASQWRAHAWKTLRQRIQWADSHRVFKGAESAKEYILKAARNIAIGCRLTGEGIIPRCFEEIEAAKQVLVEHLETVDDVISAKGGEELHSVIFEKVADQFPLALTSKTSPVHNRTPHGALSMLKTITTRNTVAVIKRAGILVDKEGGEQAPVLVCFDLAEHMMRRLRDFKVPWCFKIEPETAQWWADQGHRDLVEMLMQGCASQGPQATLEALAEILPDDELVLAQLLLRPNEGVRDTLLQGLLEISPERRRIFLTRAQNLDVPWAEIKARLNLQQPVSTIRIWFWRDCQFLKSKLAPVFSPRKER